MVIAVVALLAWTLIDSRHRGWQAFGAGVWLLVAAVAIVVIPLWRYAVHRWEITDDAVYTRVGWFDQESRVAPMSRVQTVDTERGPIERILGLATVTVTTASSAGAVRISALDLPVAEDVVTKVADVAAQTRGDAT
ncbi:membrane protein [Nocardia camponoti]|uniref:Membrane protein n=1 Tax=Nocardia camponoti TaxID=1616106 RepID=A0A917V807_9NOCA|nr:membrane protein [Nocardia camponoti]